MTDTTSPEQIDYASRDAHYWAKLSELMNCPVETVRELVVNYPSFVRRREFARPLAHYELFKSVIALPGSIVEVGVFKGSSFFTWTNLMETFCPCDRHRLVYGFDHFEGLGDFADEDGVSRDEIVGKVEQGWKAPAERARALVQLHNDDALLPGVARCKLVEGDVNDTIPKFAEENPGLRICLLHLDADLYQPTKVALEHLYPLVVTGGIVCFDEYGFTPWAGESKAVEEYFRKYDLAPVLEKFPFTPSPGGYFVKK
jgi:hypothetical protein